MTDPTIARTPVAECPACQAQRRHTAEDWQYHRPAEVAHGPTCCCTGCVQDRAAGGAA